MADDVRSCNANIDELPLGLLTQVENLGRVGEIIDQATTPRTVVWFFDREAILLNDH